VLYPYNNNLTPIIASEMASLDQRIINLELEINGYNTKLNQATTEKELDRFTNLIMTRTETLNRLLDEKRAQSGGNLQASQPAPPALPLTPRCEISCFLVLTPDGEIIGTAFAVSGELLLTAGHCMKKSHVLYIAPVAAKLVDPTTNRLVVHYPKGRVKVKVAAYNATTDYAVLKLVKEKVRQHALCTLPLTPLSIYPALPFMEDSVKAYYAYNAGLFNEAVQPLSTGIGVHSYEKISYVSDHHIHIDRGQSHGSSGGPYILNHNGVGSVVAIHLESENDVADINATSIQSSDHDLEIFKLRDAVSELSNSHSSFATGLTIFSCTELCEFLRREGAAI